jgi:hypothetical protein
LRRVLVVVALVAVLLLTMLVSEEVYATVPITFSPNSPVAGQPFTITYSGGGPSGPVDVYRYSGSSCVGVPVASGSGNSIFVSGLPAGQYCVYFVIPLVVVVFTVTAPIPEYPLGLPILAILMIIAYSVIRRRTRN